jgi:SAM-dependent methyltransferase
LAALYAATIFSGAFLLFLIEPMIAKKILPWFGGSASVWATCLLFFQMALLGGYVYADWATRSLRPKTQAVVHGVLLAATLAVLPVTPAASWKPSGGEDPLVRILALLTLTVGLPYLLLSTTGPLVQAWYSRSFGGALPYRLYALSNLGSLLALVAYPALFEPFVGTERQLVAWSVAYGAFALLCAGCALASLRKSGSREEADPPAGASDSISWSDRLLWIALAACGSTMLLAVTNHLVQNIASIPFLWIVPLTLYLASFIVCFDRPGFYQRKWWRYILAAALLAMAWGQVKFGTGDGFRLIIPVFSACLFVCCVFCHGELVQRKPAPAHLTSFYLMISIGGALGGVLVSLVAPRAFNAFYELPLVVLACGALALLVEWQTPWWHRTVWACLIVSLGVLGEQAMKESITGNLLVVRNFYGGLRVTETGTGYNRVRTLVHGTINHGEQYMEKLRRREPTTYYGRKSGVGLAIEGWRKPGERVGIIGLGTGTIAAYSQAGDYYRFYDINPLVVKIAHDQFYYLADSPAKIDIVMGDGRLSMERDPPQQFDVLAIDAFAGDSIPVHLLTREALLLYQRHLKPDGVLALHVSNANLDLTPVSQKVAESVGKKALLFDTEDDEDTDAFGATWVLVPQRAEDRDKSCFAGGKKLDKPVKLRVWTDDYSNLLQILR